MPKALHLHHRWCLKNKRKCAFNSKFKNTSTIYKSCKNVNNTIHFKTVQFSFSAILIKFLKMYSNFRFLTSSLKQNLVPISGSNWPDKGTASLKNILYKKDIKCSLLGRIQISIPCADHEAAEHIYITLENSKAAITVGMEWKKLSRPIVLFLLLFLSEQRVYCKL